MKNMKTLKIEKQKNGKYENNENMKIMKNTENAKIWKYAEYENIWIIQKRPGHSMAARAS